MSDTFRLNYKELNAKVMVYINDIKVQAQYLENEFIKIEEKVEVDKRCMELAKMNLEQAVMWAVKSIT